MTSTTSTRPEAASRYFLPVPVRPVFVREAVLLAVSGGLACLGYSLLVRPGLGGFSDGLCSLLLLAGVATGAGTAMHVVGRLLRYRASARWSMPKASGAMMDHWLAQGMAEAGALAAEAAGRHGRPEPGDGEPLVFLGIPDGDRFARGDIAAAFDDQIKRFSLYEILVLRVTGSRLLSYTELYDMRTGGHRRIGSADFPLAEVGGARTVVENLGLPSRSPAALGRASDGASWSGGLDVTALRRLELVVGGRPAVTLVVGMALGGGPVADVHLSRVEELVGLLHIEVRRAQESGRVGAAASGPPR